VQSYELELALTYVGDQLPDDLPLSEGAHVSKAAFFRLFIGEILPQSVTSVVYLDSDAVVVKDMSELLTIEMTKPIAAVDHYSQWDEYRLWGENTGNYFQSGVIIVDLSYWRENQLHLKFLDIMKNQRDKIRWWDQDVLNIAFEDSWQRLPVWFNTAQCALRALPEEDAKEKAKFLHYDGSSKPWKTDIYRPFRQEWFDAYEDLYGQPFDKRAHSRPLWRRLASKTKAILQAIKNEL